MSSHSVSEREKGRLEAASIVERCRTIEAGGLRTFSDASPFVLERAQGTWLEDADGRRYLDLSGLYAVANIGHAHPAVVDAISRQAKELIHCPSAYPSRVRAEFLEAVASIAPKSLDRVFPAMTGAMANEIAIRIAKTRRPHGRIISFSGSYFGRSVGSVGYAGKARYRDALGVPTEAQFLPFPIARQMGEDCAKSILATLEHLARPAGGLGEIAAVILEPVQGNGGVGIPPADFLPGLRAFCDRTGALLIVDEVQAGCGRTGRMWSTEHFGVEPDVMTIGKGMGGGMAVAAVLGRPEVMTWAPDTFTSTFLTNQVNLAAAVAAIGVLRQEKLVERSERLGRLCLDVIRQRLSGLPGVAEVRGLGLWIAVEFSGTQKRSAAAAAEDTLKDLRANGVIAGGGGYAGEVVKIAPPLNISETDLEAGMDKLIRAVSSASRALV